MVWLVVLGLVLPVWGAPVLPAAMSAEGGSQSPGGSDPEGSVDPDRFEVVGELPLPFLDEQWAEEDPVRDSNGWLILNPETRRAYQILRHPDHQGSFARMVIQAYDLDTLEPAGRILYDAGFNPVRPGVKTGLGNDSSGDVAHAVDEQGGRLFIPLVDAGNLERLAVDVGRDLPGTPSGDRGEPFESILVIDEHAFSEASCSEGVCEGEELDAFADRWTLPPAEQEATQFHSLQGMTFSDPGGDDTGKLLLMLADPFDNPPPLDHRLLQLDATSGELDWSHRLAACEDATLRDGGTGLYEWGLVHGGDEIHLACQNSGGSAQAVSIPLTEEGSPDPSQLSQTSVLGRPVRDVLADEAGERLILWSRTGQQNTWWVYDMQQDDPVLVGLLGVTPGSTDRVTAGIDPATGRLYAFWPHHRFFARGEPQVAQGGMGISDGRLTPPPQLGLALQDLAYPARFRIRVDPATDDRPRRLFVRRGHRAFTQQRDYPADNEPVDTPPEPFYLVIEDRDPVVTQVPREDPDRFTSGHPEEPGVTDVAFQGTGAGYGARAVLTGGLDAAANWWTAFTDDQGVPSRSSCSARDRELVFGASGPTQVSRDGARARGGSLDADGGTKVDVEQPATRCWPWALGGAPDGAQQLDEVLGQSPWADDEGGNPMAAGCVGNEDDSAEDGDARAECRQEEDEAEADATASAAQAGPVRVAAASSRTEVLRDEERGIVSRSVAEARGIEIAGSGRIGSVRVEAETWAAGRDDTAGSSFAREICGVRFPDFSESGCLDEGQREQFVRGLDRFLGTRGTVQLREPDPELAAGSPGGYIAALRRDRSEELYDRVINRDESVAVPGLEIILYYGDHPSHGSGRQIIQLAGAQATSTYGILCLFGETGDGCAQPPEPPEPSEPVDTNDEVDAAGAAGPIEPLPDAPQQDEGGSSEPRFFEEVIPAADRSSAAPQTGADRPDGDGATGVVQRVLEAPAEGLRFLMRNPGDALLLGGMWILFLAPLWLAWRRRTLRNLQEVAG